MSKNVLVTSVAFHCMGVSNLYNVYILNHPRPNLKNLIRGLNLRFKTGFWRFFDAAQFH